ncbi:MAG: lysoplasmalogenase [Chitinophagales bacterium]|nr:lysoplasmalogenase [Chitinophagales bacterium]
MAAPAKPLIVKYVLLIVSLIEFYAEFFHHRELVFFTKPLLLPLIAAYYFLSRSKNWGSLDNIMMVAFLFSWFGDISLMLTPETPADVSLMGIPKNKYFFLAGLGSFFVTQLLFIRAYSKATGVSTSGKVFISKMYFAPFILYWLAVLYYVLPPLQANVEKQSATIPVIFYAAVLISMAAVALSRFRKTNDKSFWLTFTGACIFVLSDTLIAVNFLALREPHYYASFSIITTYVVAEFLIAEGILQHQNNQP